MAPDWSRTSEEQLITEVQNHDVLYNAQNKDFKDNERKDNIWSLIALRLGIIVDGKYMTFVFFLCSL